MFGITLSTAADNIGLGELTTEALDITGRPIESTSTRTRTSPCASPLSWAG